jgi:fucose permease
MRKEPVIFRNASLFVAFGFLTLLLCSFFDNIRGPLLVPIVTNLRLTLSDAGLFLALGHLGAAGASLSLLRLQKALNDRTILLLAFGVACLTGGCASLVGNRVEFYALALLTGLVITSMGIMCNVLVIRGSPPRLLGRLLSGLHGMYGLGSFLGTTAVGYLLSINMNWTSAFTIGGVASGLMFASVAVFFPNEPFKKDRSANHIGKFRPAHLIVVATFAVYVGAEISMSMWMPTYLTKVKGVGESDAAKFASMYFLVMTGTRLLCAFWVKPKFEKPLAVACLIVAFFCFWIAYFVDYRWIVLTGLLGPFYPILFSMVSKTFSKSWRLLTTLIMLGVNGFVGLTNFTLGITSDRFGVEVSYLSGPIMLVCALGLVGVYIANEAKFSEAN